MSNGSDGLPNEIEVGQRNRHHHDAQIGYSRRLRRGGWAFAALAAAALVASACSKSPAPAASNTPFNFATFLPSPSPTPLVTATASPTPTASVLPTPAKTVAAPASPKPTPSPSVRPAVTPTAQVSQPNGGSQSVAVGTVVSLTLPQDVQEGLTWSITTSPSSAILTPTGDTTLPARAGAIPGSNERRFTFNAIAPGTTTIALTEVPAAGASPPAANTVYSVTIVVT